MTLNEQLVEKVIDHIKLDLLNGDSTAIAEMLTQILDFDEENEELHDNEVRDIIVGYLPEHEHDKFNSDNDETLLFRNQYACKCGHEWEDEYEHSCDDRCPNCRTSVSPYWSEEL